MRHLLSTEYQVLIMRSRCVFKEVNVFSMLGKTTDLYETVVTKGFLRGTCTNNNTIII